MNHPQIALMALVAELASGLALASSPPPVPAEAAPRRLELNRALDAYMLQRLRQALELTEEQSGKIEPIVRQMQEERRKHARDRSQRVRDLADRTRTPSAPDAEIDEALREIQRLDREFDEARKDREEAVMQLLTPRQRAQYLVFLQHFTQELRHKLRELREQRQERRLRRPGGPPRRPDLPDM